MRRILAATVLLLLTVILLGISVVGGAAHAQPAEVKPSPSETDDAAATKPEPPPKSSTPPDAPLPEGPLPWKQGGEPSLPAAAPKSVRETLAAFNIDEEDLAALVDRMPPSAAARETVYRVLYSLPMLGRESVEAWTAATVPWEELLANPAAHRVEFFRLRGRATSLARIDLPLERAEIYELPYYWQMTVECEGAAAPVQLLTRHAPKSWIGAEALDQPIETDGLFLHVAAGADGGDELVFAAKRLAWHPDAADQKLGIGPDLVYLSGLGVDMAELTEVTDRSSTLPREPFYQLLAAIREADTAEMERRGKEFSIVDLLQHSSRQRGQIISITGHAQQITKILVDEPDIQQRYGIDFYYEIDMFVPLKQELVLTDPNDTTKTLSYHSYPVTVCVLELPEGLAEPGKPNVFETVNRDIRLPAVFFKVWAVSTARARELGSDNKQFNPVFIGAPPEVIEYAPLTSAWMSIGVAAVFVIALAGIWLSIWRSKRGDRRFERERLSKNFEVEQGKSLNDLGIEASTGPDFSGLEAADLPAGKPTANNSTANNSTADKPIENNRQPPGSGPDSGPR